MLDEVKEIYARYAASIKDYESMSKTQLADGYCDADEAGDELMRNAYFSALVLKYWYIIFKYYETSKTAFTIDDCYDWLIHSLLYGLEKRAWRVPGNAMYQDPNGPDKIFNRCFASSRLISYQHSNTDKNKLNYNTQSFEGMIEKVGDGIYQDKALIEYDGVKDKCNSLVQTLLNKGKYLEAFIVDGIANQDAFDAKDEKYTIEGKEYFTKDDYGEYVQTKTEDNQCVRTNYSLNSKKLVKHLNSLDNLNFIRYFVNEYEIEQAAFVSSVQKVKKLSNTKLYKIIEKTLQELREDKDVKNILC